MSEDPQVNDETTEDDDADVEAHRKTGAFNEDTDTDDDGPDVEGHRKTGA